MHPVKTFFCKASVIEYIRREEVRRGAVGNEGGGENRLGEQEGVGR